MTPPAKTGLLDRLAGICLVLAALALVGMALVQFWQVFARYVLNDAPGWTEPLALILMSFAVMLGAAVAVRSESHFAFQTLLHATPPRVQQALRALARLIAAAAGAALFVYGAILVADDWAVSMPGAPLPAGLRFLALTVGGALIFTFAVERLVVPAPAEQAERD